MKIGLISDTHGYLDPKVFEYFKEVDEIWHAGDFGTLELVKQLQDFKPLRGVYGNIDSQTLRTEFPKEIFFTCEGLSVWMIHIGGYPGRYPKVIKSQLESLKPDVFICGHSHILKIMPDRSFGKFMLHINPGAAGMHGFHQVKTLVRFDIKNGKPENLEVIELGKRV